MMNLPLALSIAAGGATGAVARYVVMSQVAHVAGTAFPWATLAVNVSGSFALGALIEVLALVWSPPETVRAFLVVGGLGAFTTFSTFSMDVFYLVERHQIVAAALYVGASVALSIAAFLAGLLVLRHVLV